MRILLSGLSALLFLSIAQAQSLDQGIQLFEDGNLNEAKAFFEDVLDDSPKSPDAHYYLGRIAFEEEEFGDAVDFFEEASDLKKDTPLYHLWLGNSYGRRAQQASVLRQAGFARKCRDSYERAFEIDPTYIPARSRAIDYYMQAPGFLGGGRDKAEAQALEIQKLDAYEGVLAWEKIYNYYEEWDNLVAMYENSISLHPEVMVAYYQLYNYYFNQQDFGKAVEIARQTLVVNDTTAALYNNLGNALQRNNQYEEALQAYHQALGLDEFFYASWYQIGRLAAVSGSHLQDGKEALQKVFEAGDEVGQDVIAWSYFRLGAIHEHLNEKDKAKQAYQQAVDINPDHTEAKSALQRLK